MGRTFGYREKLEAFIDANWYCQATGLPLIFPPALCLLERLVSCAGGVGGKTHGYYDFREARWNAPLNYLTYPAADHVEPFAKDGPTTPTNLQVLALPANATKSEKKLRVIPPQSERQLGRSQSEAANDEHAILYWPPSSHFGDDPSRVSDPDRQSGSGCNARSSDWDGMLGVFLRLYHPDLPEVTVDWKPRPDGGRDDTSLMRNWYQAVWKLAQDRRDLAERYEPLKGCGGLWPTKLD
jgi:hypothetical protein